VESSTTKSPVPSSSSTPPVVLFRPLAFFDPESRTAIRAMRTFLTPLASTANPAISRNVVSSTINSAAPIATSPFPAGKWSTNRLS